jgi:hypothetical protein
MGDCDKADTALPNLAEKGFPDLPIPAVKRATESQTQS